ncbi:hypothetical protein BJ875DRAFT_369238 [Amylocarpus encephaloides]|uniref:LYR motif-containing protein Cup1-like N-terminal domain-containing protein n=1 Tax=Amylocarpus encephaloides TaxID=45428 RepID=A0A9P7YQA4_9HELO|nr:hypothetical protein BJ875DRAFT_369238 [Amylocarpus encephaloides]
MLKPTSNTVVRVWKPSYTPYDTQNVAHVYRHLLRALSYHPDPFSRAWLQERAKTQFKVKVANKNRQKTRLKRTVADIQCIERANQGDLEEFGKVLYAGYGRQGKRRRILVRDLLKPDLDDVPQDHKALAELLNSNHHSSDHAQKLVPTQRFKGFLKSQANRPELQRGASKPPELTPKIPKENIWGRPFPQKRQAALRKEWWAETLDKLYPPLPSHEWDRIRDISTGKLRVEEPLQPRTPPRGWAPALKESRASSNRRVLDILKDPIRADKELVYKPGDGLTAEEPTLPHAGWKLQDYQRSMRRLYADIWAISSKMWKNEQTREWIVEWGRNKAPSHSGAVPIVSGEDKFLIEGINDVTDFKNVRDVKSERRKRRNIVRRAR